MILTRDTPAVYISYSSERYFIVPSFVHGLKVRFLNPDFSEVWLEPQRESTN